RTSTTNWPAPGSGSSAAPMTRTSGSPNRSTTTARTADSFVDMMAETRQCVSLRRCHQSPGARVTAQSTKGRGCPARDKEPEVSQPNVRVRRTRTLLRQALVELIEDRGFDRVTVGDLAARAMISRAAFYRNYRDKYDLVEQVFDEAMAEMTAAGGDDARSPSQRFAGFLRHIDAYHQLYRALLGRKGSP